jgi:hypothetical protein
MGKQKVDKISKVERKERNCFVPRLDRLHITSKTEGKCKHHHEHLCTSLFPECCTGWTNAYVIVMRTLLSWFSENAKKIVTYMNIQICYLFQCLLFFSVSSCTCTLHRSKPKETQWKYKGTAEIFMADCFNRLCSISGCNRVACLE